ncbi:CatA-like O-acetyltransferase [Olivibacter sp. CPCC 100613]|uniref:CatA-like O-acetyltransferase n=1 Tax=Olivibacter sp. CPCC 100613 TaxID=3079931 RepID=UPI002FF91C88
MKKEVSYKQINIQYWKRQAHFNFFRSFEKPFWGITTQLNCTKAFAYCKTYRISFFCYYLYLSLRAVNSVQAFRYRLWKEEVLEYEEIGGSITVLRPDGTFGFAYFDFHHEFEYFQAELKKVINIEKQSKGLQTDPSCQHVIHYSVLPYLSFTQMEHALYGGSNDSIPKITFGKYSVQQQQLLLPMSIHVHHALCDGIDVGKFVAEFQQYMEV